MVLSCIRACLKFNASLYAESYSSESYISFPKFLNRGDYLSSILRSLPLLYLGLPMKSEFFLDDVQIWCAFWFSMSCLLLWDNSPCKSYSGKMIFSSLITFSTCFVNFLCASWCYNYWLLMSETVGWYDWIDLSAILGKTSWAVDFCFFCGEPWLPWTGTLI